MTPEQFADALTELGWKQSDFCRKTGLERNTSSRYVNGKNPIPDWVPAYLGAVLDIQRLHAKYVRVGPTMDEIANLMNDDAYTRKLVAKVAKTSKDAEVRSLATQLIDTHPLKD